MTTLNTIIEEEKNAFSNLMLEEYGKWRIDRNVAKGFLTTAIQRAYEAGQSEERTKIREEFDEWFKRGTEDVEDWAERVLTPKSNN